MEDRVSRDGIQKFFSIARERYRILQRKNAGEPKPWTKDIVLQREYFCNVFREDDKTTKWFRANIREELKDDPKEVLAAIATFRWFNKIETGEKIKPLLLGEWNSVRAHNLLAAQKPIVTGAYIIKTPDGMNKLKGVLWCVDQFIKNIQLGKFDKLIKGESSMQEACEILKTSPYLGNFMSWQICSDARKTCLLNNAKDKDIWAQPGPGSTRGLGRVFFNNVEYFNYGSKKDEEEMLLPMNKLVDCSQHKENWPIEFPPLAVIDISHQLCEHDKYCRAEEGGRMKRKYNAT